MVDVAHASRLDFHARLRAAAQLGELVDKQVVGALDRVDRMILGGTPSRLWPTRCSAFEWTSRNYVGRNKHGHTSRTLDWRLATVRLIVCSPRSGCLSYREMIDEAIDRTEFVRFNDALALTLDTTGDGAVQHAQILAIIDWAARALSNRQECGSTLIHWLRQLGSLKHIA